MGPGDFVRAFRIGDQAALAIVYREHVSDVRRLVTRWRHGALAADVEVEDLVQDIFVRIFSTPSREAYDGIRGLGPYLRKIARHFLIDRVRRRARRAVEVTSEGIENVEDARAKLHDTRTEALCFALEDQLASLPGELIRVYRYRYVLSQSQAATCRELGLTRQQLRTREKRLHERLRVELNEFSDGMRTSSKAHAPIEAGRDARAFFPDVPNQERQPVVR